MPKLGAQLWWTTAGIADRQQLGIKYCMLKVCKRGRCRKLELGRYRSSGVAQSGNERSAIFLSLEKPIDELRYMRPHQHGDVLWDMEEVGGVAPGKVEKGPSASSAGAFSVKSGSGIGRNRRCQAQ